MRKQQNEMFLSRNEDKKNKIRSEDNSQASLMSIKAGPVQSVTPVGNISRQAPPVGVGILLFCARIHEKTSKQPKALQKPSSSFSSICLGNGFEQAHSEVALLTGAVFLPAGVG